MAQCPRCKEDMPLLSKICPVCGYVIEGGDENYTAEEFINKLEENLLEIKRIPSPSFTQSAVSLTYIIFPILTLYLLVMSVLSEAGFVWILTVVFALLSVVQIVKKFKGKLGNDKSNNAFKEIKARSEYYERLAQHSYGKNKEVSVLIGDISSQIAQIESRRKKEGLKNMIIWIVIIIVFFGLAARGVISVGKAINEAQEKIEQELDI